jgi:hypothetical protein
MHKLMIIYECSANLNLFSSILLCSILNFVYVIGVHTLLRWLFPGVLQGILKTHESNIQRTEVMVLVLCFFGAKCEGC